MDLTRIAEVSAAGTAAGINPWLAALTFVVLGHFGFLELGDIPFVEAGVDDPPILIALGAAFLIEQVADKVPALDNLSDLLHLPIKPVVAAALAVVVLDPETAVGWSEAALPVGLGAAALALLAHLGKAGVRAGSTVTTAGIANPFISVLEDIGVVLLILAAVLIPLLALIIVVAAAVIAVRILVRLIRGRRRAPEGRAA